MAEGVKVLSEALDAGVPVEAVFAAPGAPAELLDRALAAGARVHDLAAGVIERVASTTTPQPVIATIPYLDVELSALDEADLVVVCVDVRDPGNAGTILRSAEAAGAGGVVCCDGCVDVFNPKAVRASAGAVFHVPVVSGGDPVDVLGHLGRRGLRRLGAVAGRGTDYTAADLVGRTAVVLGNEASGLPDRVAGCIDEEITIPMTGRAESLNVGMAAAVVCFEAARQRRAHRALAGAT